MSRISWADTVFVALDAMRVSSPMRSVSGVALREDQASFGREASGVPLG
jgi:hypothetical protein